MIPIRIQDDFGWSLVLFRRSFVLLRMLVRQDREATLAVGDAAVAFKAVSLFICAV